MAALQLAEWAEPCQCSPPAGTDILLTPAGGWPEQREMQGFAPVWAAKGRISGAASLGFRRNCWRLRGTWGDRGTLQPQPRRDTAAPMAPWAAGREAAWPWGRDCSKPSQTLSLEGCSPLWQTEALGEAGFSLFVPSPIKSKTP